MIRNWLTRRCRYLFLRSEGTFTFAVRETRGYEKEESVGLASSTEERRICSNKEPSLCERACAPGRFMLEMHLMVHVHPSEVRMMNDAACILVHSAKELSSLNYFAH